MTLKPNNINKQSAIPLPVSEYQKRFFLEWALAPEDSSYNESMVYKLTGNLDKITFKSACEIFFKLSEVTHAQFSEDGNNSYYGDFSIEDFYRELTFDKNIPVSIQIRELLEKPFNLTSDVLYRFYLIDYQGKDNKEFIFISHFVLSIIK